MSMPIFARMLRQIETEAKDPIAYTCTYIDKPGTFGYKYALDLIPETSIHIKNFHKDELKLSSEYCFVFPTKGCYFSEHTAEVIGATPKSRKKIWACAVSKCVYEKKMYSDVSASEMYKTSIEVFDSKEQAIIHATLIGFLQPQVFNTLELPSYVKLLLRFIVGTGGTTIFSAEVYRHMVLSGFIPPIKKFIRTRR